MTRKSLTEIMERVAEQHGLSVTNMLASTSARPIVNARAEYFYRAMVETTASSAQIGQAIGKDHSTVLYGAVKHAKQHGLPVARGHCTGVYTRHGNDEEAAMKL